MAHYYNDNEASSADWLGGLIANELIPGGRVDGRSITEVAASDLDGFRQCHFFAGIGGWPYALQLAGWPIDEPVWTASCPCQPFSTAGKRKGYADERHLWPVFAKLVAECRPPVVFGEQVASPAGRDWLAGVRREMEELGYVVGAADLCAAGVGAPHIRQRLYWVAYTQGERSGASGPAQRESRRRQQSAGRTDSRVVGGLGGLADAGCEQLRSGGPGEAGVASRSAEGAGDQRQRLRSDAGSSGAALPNGLRDAVCERQQAGDDAAAGAMRRDEPVMGCGGPERMGDANGAGRQPRQPPIEAARHGAAALTDGGRSDGLGDSAGPGLQERAIIGGAPSGPRGEGERQPALIPSAECWSDFIIVRDNKGKLRRTPVEPAFFPLADGLPGRVAQLRGLGNAIVPQLAAVFIEEAREAINSFDSP